MEQEPSMNISFPDGFEFEAKPDNTVLFTFMGKLALYDHVFFIRDEEKGQGSYLFNLHSSYEEVKGYMLENGYPAHINMQEVAECDMNAFDHMLHNDAEAELESGVPDDWS